jgi:hypothetical protein
MFWVRVSLAVYIELVLGGEMAMGELTCQDQTIVHLELTDGQYQNLVH